MNYELCKYETDWAIYCKTSRCYVLFGGKNDLRKRLTELNQNKDE